MNYLIFAAGLISFMAVVGHFAMGTKMYLRPVLISDIDEIPKRVMESLFHYMSVFMILTTVLLLSAAFEISIWFENINDAVLLTGIIYGGFALAQFIIALLSSVKMGILKMFQWIFWTAISTLSILGAS